MKRRTFISLMSVMAAAGVLSLAGCSSNTSASTVSSTAASASAAAANKLETIQSNGKLVIALEGAWQPWSFHDESDTLVGYDVEVSRAIAEKLGVEPEYVESDWDSLFAGLDAGRYDLVCNGVEVTETYGGSITIDGEHAITIEKGSMTIGGTLTALGTVLKTGPVRSLPLPKPPQRRSSRLWKTPSPI